MKGWFALRCLCPPGSVEAHSEVPLPPNSRLAALFLRTSQHAVISCLGSRQSPLSWSCGAGVESGGAQTGLRANDTTEAELGPSSVAQVESSKAVTPVGVVVPEGQLMLARACLSLAAMLLALWVV